MNISLHEMVEEVVRNAEAQAQANFDDFEKTASDVSDVPGTAIDEIDLEEIEKVAEAVEGFIDVLSSGGELQVKVAGDSGSGGPAPGKDEPATVETKDGKPNYETGKAKSQPKSSGEEKAVGGGTNHVATAPSGHIDSEQPQISGTKSKSAASREAIKERILAKLGGAPEGGDRPGVTAAGEGTKATGKAAAMFGKLDGKASFSKGDAKKLVKPDLAKVLKEPALSKASDPVLHNNLRNASKAGVKIAGSMKDVVRTRLADAMNREEADDA